MSMSIPEKIQAFVEKTFKTTLEVFLEALSSVRTPKAM